MNFVNLRCVGLLRGHRQRRLVRPVPYRRRTPVDVERRGPLWHDRCWRSRSRLSCWRPCDSRKFNAWCLNAAAQFFAAQAAAGDERVVRLVVKAGPVPAVPERAPGCGGRGGRRGRGRLGPFGPLGLSLSSCRIAALKAVISVRTSASAIGESTDCSRCSTIRRARS